MSSAVIVQSLQPGNFRDLDSQRFMYFLMIPPARSCYKPVLPMIAVWFYYVSCLISPIRDGYIKSIAVRESNDCLLWCCVEMRENLQMPFSHHDAGPDIVHNINLIEVKFWVL